MAIFAIRSSVKNVSNENSPDNPNNESTKTAPTPPPTSSGPRQTEAVPEPVMQFDDDMAHFVSHLDADPLTETEVKMHLVEYDYSFGADDALIREISDDDDEYT